MTTLAAVLTIGALVWFGLSLLLAPVIFGLLRAAARPMPSPQSPLAGAAPSGRALADTPVNGLHYPAGQRAASPPGAERPPR